MIKVSVCMVTYNHEKFIAQAIEGVLMQQTSFDFELVIGEDFSTDNTRQVIKKYADANPDKIKVLLRDKNLGTMPNFIESLQTCRGEYIALCEGDDFWVDPLKLQKQVDLLEKNKNAILCFTNLNDVEEDGNIKVPKSLLPRSQKEQTQSAFLAGLHIPIPTIMFRNKVAKGLPASFATVFNGDTYLCAYLLSFGNAVYLDAVTAHYRLHGGGIWSALKAEHRVSRGLHTFKQILKDVPLKDPGIVFEKIHTRYKNLLWMYLAQGQKSKAIDLYKDLVKFDLSHKKFFFLTLQLLTVKRTLTSFIKKQPAE